MKPEIHSPYIIKGKCRRDHAFTGDNVGTYKGKKFCRKCKSWRRSYCHHKATRQALGLTPLTRDIFFKERFGFEPKEYYYE